MNPEFLQKLQMELDRLADQVRNMRLKGSSLNEIEQHTNNFQTEWLEKIAELRAEVPNHVRVTVEATFAERALRQNTIDNERMKGMTPEAQIAYWGVRTGYDANRAAEMTEAKASAVKQINDGYNEMGYALVKAIDQVERSDRKPSFGTHLLAEHKAAMAEVEDRQQPTMPPRQAVQGAAIETPQTSPEEQDHRLPWETNEQAALSVAKAHEIAQEHSQKRGWEISR